MIFRNRNSLGKYLAYYSVFILLVLIINDVLPGIFGGQTLQWAFGFLKFFSLANYGR